MAGNYRAAQVLATSVQVPTVDANRRSANFHPTVWGDHFLDYTADSICSLSEQVQVLKEDVRKMFTSTTSDPKTKLDLIDALQRLGIAYHFESEIEEALDNIYKNKQDFDHEDDLYTVALLFRLLRQQGYIVSSRIFDKFKDENKNFKEELVNDVNGMLSLYEASHLSVHGEEILDEALVFTTINLQHSAKQVNNSSIAEQINHALKRPIRKALTRQEARYNIDAYQQIKSRDETVLRLSMLDFNRVQKMHQEELSNITKWWKELDFATKLPYARDRIVECYFWPLGVFFEPNFSVGRKLFTKAIQLYSVIDDTYDVYATPEELEIFTKVVERCDGSMMHELPSYMKECYQALLDIYSEIAEEAAKEGLDDITPYLKETTRNLVRAYLVEARWFNENHVPTTEEYISNALTTSVYPMLILVSFCGMGKIASKEAFDWLMSFPKMVKAASTICRIMDDIVSHKFEQSRGHVASVVECYVKQHGTSEEEAYDALNKMVNDAWKDINEELLKPAVPVPLLHCILNHARVIDVVYKDADGYTDSKVGLRNIIEKLLLNPVVYSN